MRFNLREMVVHTDNAIKATGSHDRIRGLAALRERFHETRSVACKLVRVSTSTGAVACLAWALVVCGRQTA